MNLSSVKPNIIVVENIANKNDMNLFSVKPQTVMIDNIIIWPPPHEKDTTGK